MIYTSYFANIKKLPKDLKLVSIARGIPDWFTGSRCEELDPSWDTVMMVKNNPSRITKVNYIKEYEKQLEKLDVNTYASMFDGCVLLCYEKPGDFCHRQLVARWLKINGYKCEEFLN